MSITPNILIFIFVFLGPTVLALGESVWTREFTVGRFDVEFQDVRKVIKKNATDWNSPTFDSSQFSIKDVYNQSLPEFKKILKEVGGFDSVLEREMYWLKSIEVRRIKEGGYYWLCSIGYATTGISEVVIPIYSDGKIPDWRLKISEK